MSHPLAMDLFEIKGCCIDIGIGRDVFFILCQDMMTGQASPQSEVVVER